MKALRACLVILLVALGLSCHPKTAPLVATQDQNTPILDSISGTDQEIAAFIKPFRDSLHDEMNRLVTILPQKITHSRNNPHSRIGPWLCDILLIEGRESFPDYTIHGSFYNPGGIRMPQLKDSITVGDLYELLPFDNTLVLLEMSGQLLQTWVNHTLKKGGWPMSNTFQIYASPQTPNRVLINQRPVEMDQTYRILTNDYVAGGGDQCDFLRGSAVAETKGYIRDIVIRHFDKGNQPKIPTQNRIFFMNTN